jgi:ketosteroid isomerase-like protein
MADNAHRAFSSYASDDVSLLAPGAELITGHTAVAAHIAKEPARKLTGWHTLRAGVARGGDLGYTAGAFEISAQGAQKSEHAVYLFAWRKYGGSWKIAAIVRNPAEGPPAPGLKLIKTQPPESMADPGDVSSAAIIKADTDFSNLSQKTNVPEAFAAYIADNGTLLGVITEPVSGEQAVGAQFPPSPRKGVLAWKPVKADMSSTGDIGYTIGRAEFKGEDREGKPVTGYTKYLTIWIRQADGSWRYIIDGGNSVPPPAGKI